MQALSLFELMSVLTEKADPKKKVIPSGWRGIAKYLTPEERGNEGKVIMRNIINCFKSLPKDEEFIAAAKAGEAKRGWYAKSGEAIQSLFGPDTPRFVALLSSTSPQNSVVENMRLAMRIWRSWVQAGRPMDPKAIDTLGAQAIGHERWHAMQAWRQNSILALTTKEEDLPHLALSGQKVNSFRKNLLGDLAAVTNDAWMANFALIDQSVFGSLGGYSAYTAKVRRVAEKMGWQPAEVQETIWSFFKALYEKQTADVKGMDALGQLNDQDVNSVPDFANLMMEDPDVRSELERLGLAKPGAPGEQPGTDGSQPGGPGSDAGVPAGSGDGTNPLARAAQGGLVGHVEKVAARAQELQWRRDLETDIKFSYALPGSRVIRAGGSAVTLAIGNDADRAAIQQLEQAGKLQRVVSTAAKKDTLRDMLFLLVPQNDKWVFIKDPKVTLNHQKDDLHQVQVRGTAVKVVKVPPEVAKDTKLGRAMVSPHAPTPEAPEAAEPVPEAPEAVSPGEPA